MEDKFVKDSKRFLELAIEYKRDPTFILAEQAEHRRQLNTEAHLAECRRNYPPVDDTEYDPVSPRYSPSEL